jgi:hypothetical protein
MMIINAENLKNWKKKLMNISIYYLELYFAKFQKIHGNNSE